MGQPSEVSGLTVTVVIHILLAGNFRYVDKLNTNSVTKLIRERHYPCQDLRVLPTYTLYEQKLLYLLVYIFAYMSKLGITELS